MNSLFFPAAALFGTVLYTVWKKVNQGSGVTTTLNSVLKVLRQYGEVDDHWSDPLNLVSNPERNPKVKTEKGQNGIPRVIYQGPGESEIPMYGHNYHSL